MTERRIIKFRAWDNEKKEMYSPIHKANKGNLFELFMGMSGDLCAHVMNGMEHESVWQKERFQVMQFTGLHDKNGAEIYEDDRLKNKDSDLISTVDFNDGTFWIVNKLFTSPLGELAHEIEVIGNSFEHPNLL